MATDEFHAELKRYIRPRLESGGALADGGFTRVFQRQFGPDLALVALYGSRLFASNPNPNSYPDFFVVADSYRRASSNPLLRLLSRALPPVVFNAVQTEQAGGEYCKFNVLTRDALAGCTGAPLKDLYVAGRLSKYVAVAWARDSAALEEFAAASASSLLALAPAALSLLPDRFNESDFGNAAILISYTGEARPFEASKARQIYAAMPDWYNAVRKVQLRCLEAMSLIRREEGVWHKTAQCEARAFRVTIRRLQERSKRRALARLLRNMLTLSEWRRMALDKLRRTGVPVEEFTALELRLPFPFAVPRLYKLWRRGYFRSVR